jgi:OOP family OmpA-OmpF porin
LSYFFGQHTTAAKIAAEPPPPPPPSPPPPPPPVPLTLPPCAAPIPAWNSSIYFDYNDARPKNVASLDEIIRRLQQYPQSAVNITGFTDDKGASAYNLALSRRRAEAVAAYLRDRGIATQRIVVDWRGESEVDTGQGEVRDDAMSRRVRITSPAIDLSNANCLKVQP